MEDLKEIEILMAVIGFICACLMVAMSLDSDEL